MTAGEQLQGSKGGEGERLHTFEITSDVVFLLSNA
jgi:hypothetical protein